MSAATSRDSGQGEKGIIRMSDAKRKVAATGRVSPTAPESKSLSAAVWSWLEHVPGMSARITKAEADMKAGEGTPWKDVAKKAR